MDARRHLHAQYQPRPHPPGEGGGHRGPCHWLEPAGPEMPGGGLPRVAFLDRSPADAFEAELFAGPTPQISSETSTLRRTITVEWFEHYRTVLPRRLAENAPPTPPA